MKLGIIKNKSNIMLLCLLASIAFAYTCSSPTGSGDGGNPPNPCLTDPFGSTCGDDFLQARVNDCITAGNASETRCEAIFTEDSASANTCLVNPFTDACKTDTAFITYTETARTNRVNFCASDSTGSLLCTALTTCQNNPFDASCGEYFAEAKIRHCATTPACTDGVITNADWLEGFDAPLNTAGDRERTVAHEFLQGTEDGLNVGSVATNGIIDTTIRPLDLESFGGEAKNGVAWFSVASGATGLDLPIRLYSGIFSGTNLGAPLTSADASVSVPWKGKFGNIFYTDVNNLSTREYDGQDFDLTVDFANSEIRAFVKRDIFAPADTDHFLLKATFDDRGRFDGTIKHGTFAGNDKDATPTNVTNGVLTGLIGELGAVGAFISDEADIATTNQAYSGGFVAFSQKEAERIEQAKIKYTDWIGGFDEAPPASPSVSPAINQFLAGTTTLDPLTTATPTLLTSTIGGEGFFTENSAYYAGLLANTNVGLPVEITPQANSADVTATWRGKIQAIGVFLGRNSDTDPDNTSTMDFDLTVNFTARTLTGQARDSRHSGSLGRRIDINGNFLEANNGVITTGTAIARVANVARSGVLTGIIGQEGAVGAFIGDGFSGGFYAAPTQ